MVELSQVEVVSNSVIVYLNRLSDLLFAMARRENFRAGKPDVAWHANPSDADSENRLKT